jgi:hypothetical protein
MTAGIQIYNTNGVIQIDENLKNPRLVTTGSVAQGTDNAFGSFVLNLSAFGIDLNTEIPLLLLRPSAFGQNVGGVFITKKYGSVSGGNYFLIDASNASFDYAVFSTQVAGIKDTDPGGFQVFNTAGEITYDSNNRHTRIIANLYHAATSSYPYPYNLSMTGFTAMPWIVANPLVASYLGSQDEASGIYAKVNSLTSLTISHQVLGAAGSSFAGLYGSTIAQSADPYNNRSMTLGMADWA